MKYGKTLHENALPQWRQHYMDYKGLKKIISRCQAERAWQKRRDSQEQHSPQAMKLELPGPNAQLNTVFAPPPLSSPSTPVNVPGGSAESPSSDKTALFSLADHIAYFYFYVQRQLEGVNGFFEGERTILLNRLEEIGARLPAVRQAAEDGLCHKQLDALVGASRAVLDDLHDLHQFAVANFEGFRKILKKFDKKVGRKDQESVMANIRQFSFARREQMLEPSMETVKLYHSELVNILRRVTGTMASVREHGKKSPLPSFAAAHSTIAEAAERGDTAAVEAAYATVLEDEQSELRAQLLTLAALRGDDKLAAMSLRWGAAADMRDVVTGNNAWHVAATAGQAAVLAVLAASQDRARVTEQLAVPNADGRTPLLLATRYGHTAACAALCEAGADANLSLPTFAPPLFSAIEHRHLECARVLLDHGANPNWVDTNALTSITPLLLACERRMSSLTELLLERGANATICDASGESAVHKAAASGCTSSLEAVLAAAPLLLNARDELDLQTPLFHAVKGGRVRTMRKLIEAGAVPGAYDINGWTARTHALYRGLVDIAAELQRAEQAASPAAAELAKHARVPISSVVADRAVPLDVTSFIDKQGPSRARGHEKTVTVSEKSFGHEFLRNTCRALVDLVRIKVNSGLDAAVADPPEGADPYASPAVAATAPSLGSGLRRCRLVVDVVRDSPDSTETSPCPPPRAKFILLPLHQEGENVAIDMAANAAQGGRLRINFWLVSLFDDNDIVGRGSVGDLDWRSTHEQHIEKTCELFDPRLRLVGRVHFRYLLVTPFANSKVKIREGNTYWFTRKQVQFPVWGHRGSGASKSALVPELALHRTHVQENTVLSFVTAASLGAEYVEFDVQLTRDSVPVIYHNWTLEELLEYPLAVNQLTLGRFQALKEAQVADRLLHQAHISRREAEKLAASLRRQPAPRSTLAGSGPVSTSSAEAGLGPFRGKSPLATGNARAASSTECVNGDSAAGENGTGDGEGEGIAFASPDEGASAFFSPPIQTVHDETRRSRPRLARSSSNPDLSRLKAVGDDGGECRRFVRAPMATLRKALQDVPRSVGFNIEVKYPLLESQEEHGFTPADINTFLDRMLTEVYDCAEDRNIVFSSFHPDVCRMLALKQPNYPVLFLTSAGYYERYSDERANSLRAALRFAQNNSLLGIVSNARPFVECPELVREVKAAGLLLLTWGADNNNIDAVRLQEACGVDAVITDHVAHVRKGLTPREEGL